MEHFAFRSMVAGKRADAGESELYRLARDFDGQFERLVARLTEMTSWHDIPKFFEAAVDTEDIYSWGRLATYVLWRYENHLRSQPGRQFPKLGWKTVVSPANQALEYEKDHIEPKVETNPRLQQLVKWNPQSPDEGERPFGQVFLNRLGNLVLDTRSAGASKGSLKFTDRIPHYLGSGLLSQAELVQTFASKDEKANIDWDEDAIRRRQQALVKFVKDML